MLIEQLSIENNQMSDITGFAIRGEGPNAQVVTTGNQIETQGADPAVLLKFERGDSVFSYNQCTRRGGDSPNVVLGGDTLIVASDRVVGAGVSLDLHAQGRRLPVLGNIASAQILVNGGALPAPWPPLNLEGVV